jgi:GxxExxY protein
MNVYDFHERREVRADEQTEFLARAVIGATIEVHLHLGPGLPEVAYRRALSHELAVRGIEHQWESPVPTYFKGVLVGEGRVDTLVGGRLIVEIKVVEHLTGVHRAQVLAYLQALELQLGLFANFNVAIMKDGIRRVISTF